MQELLTQATGPQTGSRTGSKRTENVLVGTETADDAGVYLLRPSAARSDGIGLVQTVDLISPLCDDPETFGKIAAANALSDVYAMGGRPISALNICVFPKDLPPEAARRILAGAACKLDEAHVDLLGGHTVRGPELLFGLSVTGLVSPACIWRNVGAKPGDVLLLTKPLGSGLLATAYRRGLVSLAEAQPVFNQLSHLNRAAAEALSGFPVSAATDVTGFGLAGHALGMTHNGDISLRICSHKLPVYEGVLQYAETGVTCGGAKNNRKTFSPKIHIDPTVSESFVELAFDPQTSGGLLLTLPAVYEVPALSALHAAGVQACRIGDAIPAAGSPLLLCA